MHHYLWAWPLTYRHTQPQPQRGGVRPFGVSCVIAGANPDGTATLYQTDPAGTYSAWKAAAVGGRNASNMQVRVG